MSLAQTRRPLLHWDRSTLRFDLDAVEQVINQHLDARHAAIRRLTFHTDRDGVLLRGAASLKGVVTALAVRIEELKLYRRFFGCRVTSLRGPLGVPLPLALLERLIDSIDSPSMLFDSEDGIFTYDLRGSLPPGLDLTVSDVRCFGRELVMTIPPGSWRPTVRDVLLPPDTPGDLDDW